MLTLLIANLAAAFAAPLLVARARRAAPWLLAAVPLGAAAALLAGWDWSARPDLMRQIAWAPQLGVEFALRGDGLGLLFVALIGLVGGFVVLHAGSYLASSPRLGRFYLLLFVFMGAMFGLVLADNLWLLFVCWELTSITSYFLIGFKHEQAYARDAARRALLTTGAGGLALLGGFALLAAMGRGAGLDATESARISALLAHGPALQQDPRYLPALGLILLGAFTKSAQMPFHHWLPLAMAGPTPVSALLHSATMVKAGVYLLARLHPALGGTAAWEISLASAGAVTMVGGALLAVARTDLKEILAYTTISALGTLVLLIGLGTPAALGAMVVFLTVHALYKSSLFLVVANLDHGTGTRDLRLLGGWGRVMPLTAAAALLAALGQAGAPPALGYLGKKLALQAKLAQPSAGELLTVAAVLTNIAMVALALALAVRPFWGRRLDGAALKSGVPAAMGAGPLVLAVLGIVVGLVPSLFDAHLGTAAASAAAGYDLPLKLKVWSGLSLEFLLLAGLSVAVFAAGALVYRRLDALHRQPALPAALTPLTPTRHYDAALGGFLRLCAGFAARLQSGRLRSYVTVTTLAVGALALPWLLAAGTGGGAAAGGVAPHEAVLVVIMAVGALAGAFTGRPIVAVLAVGMTGFGLALVFALYGGIDLAITQLLVETLLVVILAVVLSRLPRRMRPAGRAGRARDLAVAAVLGLTVTMAVLLPAAGGHDRGLAETFLALSVPEAHGRNVVNVILVDFRAMDTLGEIVVVAAAALTVAALLRRDRRSAS